MVASMGFQRGESIRVVHPLFQVEGGGSIPTSPLQLRFEQVASNFAASLNEEWHSVLPYIPVFHIQIAFGAFFNDVCYAVAMFGRPVARTICDKGWLELRRMAIANDAPKNTATRMLSWMVREVSKMCPDVVKIISYQDSEHHKGTIYKAQGWTPVKMEHSPVNWGGTAQKKKPPTRSRRTKILKSTKIRWERNLKIRDSNNVQQKGKTNAELTQCPSDFFYCQNQIDLI